MNDSGNRATAQMNVYIGEIYDPDIKGWHCDISLQNIWLFQGFVFVLKSKLVNILQRNIIVKQNCWEKYTIFVYRICSRHSSYFYACLDKTMILILDNNSEKDAYL